MLRISLEPYITIGSTPKLQKDSKSAIALSPVAPLVADTGKWDSGSILRITDYQIQTVVGQVPILHSFQTLSFSPDGKHLLVVPSGRDHSNVLLVYGEPWNSPQVICENQSLHDVFHGVWLDEETILVAGIARSNDSSNKICIAVLNVTEGTIRVVLRESPQLHLIPHDHRIDSACSSPCGLVVFIFSYNVSTFSYEKEVLLYQLNETRDGILSQHSFLIHDAGYGRLHVAIAEDGQTILCQQDLGNRINLFDRQGLLLNALGTSRLSNLASYRYGTVCLREYDGTKFYKVRDKRFHFWCFLQGTSSSADLVMQDGKVLAALEEEGQTSVLELTDFDLLQLASDEPTQRREAVQRLAERRFQPAVLKLVYLLEDEDLGVQEAVVDALAAIGDPTALPYLIRTLGYKQSDHLRDRIISALRRFPVTQLVPAISQCIARPGVTFHRGAVRVLEAMPSIEALEILCQEISDRDREIQLAAAHALRKRADIRACPTLLGHLNDIDERVRVAIQQAVVRTLRVSGLLSDDVSNQLSIPMDVARYAQEVISAGRMRGFAGIKTSPAGAFLVALAEACVQSDQSLPQLLDAIDTLASNEAFQASAAIGLTIAVICAATVMGKRRWREAVALYQDAVTLAKQAEAPQMEWRAWDAIGQCFVALEDDPAALTAFRNAMDVIDRLWFDLLEEDKLRGFFRDKALLYDRAGVCALRLGHQALALECLEKAKTRYLGDLIARRQKEQRTVLDQELREFWDNIDSARSIRVAADSPQAAVKERVEIVAVQWGSIADGAGDIQPERMAAFEEACWQRKELQHMLDMLRDIWRLVAYLSPRDEDLMSQHVQHVKDIYQALLPIHQAVKSAALPIAENEQEISIKQFNDAAEALRSSGENIQEAHFWILSEYRHLWRDWIKEIGNSLEAGETALFLEAVMEALNVIVDDEAVFGVPANSANGDEQEGLIFTTHALNRQRPSPDQRTTTIKTLLEHREQTRWRYNTRIARGEIVTYREVADTIQGQSGVAQLEFAVYESGTVIYVTHGLEDRGRQSGEIPTLRGENSLFVFTCPEVTLPWLHRLLTQETDWLGRYQLRRQPGGLQAWMDAMDQVLQKLYTFLIVPLEAHLKDRGVKRLRIIPHRALHLIPFSALHRKDRGRCHFLGDDYDIEYAPSATIQHICRERTRGRPPLRSLTAVANPTSDLPFAVAEVERVVACFPSSAVQVWYGEVARLEVVKSSVPRSVFHFAGHGRYDWADPLASHLLFARSEQLDLADLFAEAIQLPETSLAVLSACETTITNPEDLADEYLGLASGFLFAGTPWVVSTLWAVDDMSTALLMARFYQNHFKDGLYPSRALQTAQRWLRETVSRRDVVNYIKEQLATLEGQRKLAPRWSEAARSIDRQIRLLVERLEHFTAEKRWGRRPFAHPYYWAAFTLSGGGQIL